MKPEIKSNNKNISNTIMNTVRVSDIDLKNKHTNEEFKNVLNQLPIKSQRKIKTYLNKINKQIKRKAVEMKRQQKKFKELKEQKKDIITKFKIKHDIQSPVEKYKFQKLNKQLKEQKQKITTTN